MLYLTVKDQIVARYDERVISRRGFLQSAAAAVAGQRIGRPRASEFVFARLRYDSGDWDYNPKVAANVLDSIVQYTSIPVYRDEVVIGAASTELPSFPFVFMTGHKLVRFTTAERASLRAVGDAGGLLANENPADETPDTAKILSVLGKVFPLPPGE